MMLSLSADERRLAHIVGYLTVAAWGVTVIYGTAFSASSPGWGRNVIIWLAGAFPLFWLGWAAAIAMARLLAWFRAGFRYRDPDAPPEP